jgi:deoxyribodipyrimidine photo-lyase
LNLVWFRNDLRVDDNPALFHACEGSNEPVLALYFICKEQDKSHGLGRNYQNLRLSALKNLKQRLQDINIDLLIIQSKNYNHLVDDLLNICEKSKVKNLFFNNEYSVNERVRDNQVRETLLGVTSIFHFNGDSLLPPESILNKSGLPYKVFTPFANAVRVILQYTPIFCYYRPKPMPTKNYDILRSKSDESNEINSRQSFESLDRDLFQLKEMKHLDINILDIDNLNVQPIFNNDITISVPNVDELYLRDRLLNFSANNIENYEQERDFPDLESTSQLSFGLAVGAISVRRCYQIALDMSPSNSASWLNELIWRDFYRAVMWHFPHVSKYHAFKSVDRELSWSHDLKEFDKWKCGETGIPIIDAAMKQLLTTGWMHNRLRMVTACYLCKNLWMDWRLGEQFFAEHLFDYDFASNNGGWQWCASVGTDAAPYFRVFNPANQQKRFDPDARFIKKWLPQLVKFTAKEIHNFESKPLAGYQPLQIDLKPSRKQAIERFKQALQ